MFYWLDMHCNLILDQLINKGRVEVSGGMDNIVKQVKCEILAQQQMVVWQKDHTLGVF